jgi:hypothetical protein
VHLPDPLAKTIEQLMDRIRDLEEEVKVLRKMVLESAVDQPK